MLSSLYIIIRPEPIDLAEDIRLTPILEHDACQRVLSFDLVYVNESVFVHFVVPDVGIRVSPFVFPVDVFILPLIGHK